MQVIKRDGTKQSVAFDKISSRIKLLCTGLDTDGVKYGEPLMTLDPIRLAMQVIGYIKNNITTRELDEYTAESAVVLTYENPEYGILAGRILVSNLHKNTLDSFSITMKKLYEYKDERGHPSPLISRDLYKFVEKFSKRIDSEIDYLRDYRFSYEGFKTIERSYLLKYQSGSYKVQERPQHMWMRVALGIHGPSTTAMIPAGLDNLNDLKKADTETVLNKAFETYHLLSQGYFTHATPTLYNAGTPRPQLSSCFLLPVPDHLKGIFKALSDCAEISKNAGGIGLHITDVRAAGSYIHGTNGRSNGILPMLKVFNDTAKYVDQCFKPDTLIYTPEGPVAISELRIGDLIITDRGVTQKVQRVLCHNVRSEVLSIDIAYNLDPVVVTGEHQVLIVRREQQDEPVMDQETFLDRLHSGHVRPEWIDVRNLRIGDYVCFPKPMDDLIIVDIPDLSIDDLRFYGILLMQGIITNSGMVLPVSQMNNNCFKFCNEYLRKQNIPTAPNQEFQIERSFLTKYGNLYNNQGKKHIDKRFFRLPKEKCLAILQGSFLFHNDLIEHPPKSILEGLRFLSWRCDIQKTPDPKEKDFLIRFVSEEFGSLLLTCVMNIKKESYEGDLYDLEVDNDHTYITANLGIVHNGGGKRMGSFAVYIEPWHPEILSFLQAKLPNGHEELRARDLFYALWIPDLFMKKLSVALESIQIDDEGRSKRPVLWSTFCPHECPGLSDSWGEAFEDLYHKYENEGRARSQIDIMVIWQQILDLQKETGACYIMYKDAANRKSNQQNLGTIKGSNLCTEIIEYSDDKEYATCNLASIALPKHLRLVKDEAGDRYEVDHATLMKTAYIITHNLNRVIDVNYYPVPETKISNERHRPLGIGVQGLADLFHILKLPFDSAEAGIINRDIFETIYYGALKASHDLAVKDGPYETFKGSPASKGILQFDMWEYKPCSGRWDWDTLKEEIVKDGIRNSLLIAPMPTASTAQILGNTECFEPVSYNIFVKRVLAGEFTIVNKYLQQDLIKLGLWTENLRERLLRSRGSIQDTKLFPEIPMKIRNLYKTAFEIKQRVLIDMAAARGCFVDQSQSFNVFLASPNDSSLTSMHLYGWKQGLKTGMYYLRRETVAKSQQFTIAPRNFSERTEKSESQKSQDSKATSEKADNAYDKPLFCRRDDPTCEACSG